MSDWRDIELGEAIELYDYKRVPLSKAERSTRQGCFPYYGAQGVIDYVDDYLFDGRYILIPEDGENLNSRKLPIASFAVGKFWVNNHAHIARALEGIAVDRFIQSALEATDIGGFITGAAQPKLTQANLLRIPLRLPGIGDQLKIASVFDALDDLIENNRRRIELLEQTAQAIYREWFVHRAGSDGWASRKISEVATIVRGRSYRKQELVDEGGVPFINLKCMQRGGGFRRDGLKRYEDPFKPAQQTRTGDIVMAVTDLTQSREILARSTLVPRLDEDFGVISLDVVRIVPRDEADRLPLFLVLRHSDLSERVKEFANGSTVLHLSADHLSEALIPWPSDDVRREIAALVGDVFGLVDELADAAGRLVRLRDLLLPKLVTGAIDVSHLDLDGLLDQTSA